MARFSYFKSETIIIIVVSRDAHSLGTARARWINNGRVAETQSSHGRRCPSSDMSSHLTGSSSESICKNYELYVIVESHELCVCVCVFVCLRRFESVFVLFLCVAADVWMSVNLRFFRWMISVLSENSGFFKLINDHINKSNQIKIECLKIYQNKEQ